MIIKILNFELKKNFLKNKSLYKFIRNTMLIPIILFIFSMYLNKHSNSNVSSIAIVLSALISFALFQIKIAKTIKEINKDPLILFIKDKRFNFIKCRLQIEICKCIISNIVPLIIPLIFYSYNKVWMLSLSLLGVISFYLINMILACAISYFENTCYKGISNKIKYICTLICLVISWVAMYFYLIYELLTAIFKPSNVSFNIYFKYNIVIFITLNIVFLGLYILILNVIKNNLYVILNSVSKSGSSNLSKALINLKVKNLLNKILLKDLCHFIRNKGLNFYCVIGIQVISVLVICFTIITERAETLSLKLSQISMFYMFCSGLIFFNVIMAYKCNLNNVLLKEDISVINKFNIKIDKFKLFLKKCDFVFVLSSPFIFIVVLINFVLDISLNGLIQNFLIAILLLSCLRYLTLVAVDIANFGFNELRCVAYLCFYTLSFKISINIMESNRDVILKYVAILGINIIGYYIHLLLIKFIERRRFND